MDADATDALRVAGRDARRLLEGDQRAAAETRITAHLSSMQWPVGATIGVTASDDGEPDLCPIVERLRGRGHALALPVIDPDDDRMRFVRWFADDRLEPGRFGIATPPDDPARHVVPSALLVPLVRFDSNGNRIGRGRGYYDRWLANHPDALRIGVAFETQRHRGLCAEPHDEPLDAVVTELGIRWFGSRQGR